MCSIYTIEYYSAIKNRGIMKFAGKWMELENIMLSEITKIQNDIHSLYLLVDISHKVQDTYTTTHTPNEAK